MLFHSSALDLQNSQFFIIFLTILVAFFLIFFKIIIIFLQEIHESWASYPPFWTIYKCFFLTYFVHVHFQIYSKTIQRIYSLLLWSSWRILDLLLRQPKIALDMDRKRYIGYFGSSCSCLNISRLYWWESQTK